MHRKCKIFNTFLVSLYSTIMAAELMTKLTWSNNEFTTASEVLMFTDNLGLTFLKINLKNVQHNTSYYNFTQWINSELERQHYPLGHEWMRFITIPGEQWQPNHHPMGPTEQPQSFRQMRFLTPGFARYPNILHPWCQNSRRSTGVWLELASNLGIN